MMKKTIAALLALMMTASLCACGSDDDPAETGSKELSAASESDAPAETTAPADSGSSADEGTSDAAGQLSYGEKPSASDELATVQYLADTYFKAIKNKDYDTLVDITDAELMCYISDGEMPDRDAQIEYVKSLCSDGGTDYTVSKPEKESGYAEEYNEFFKTLDEQQGSKIADKFKVEDAYSVRLKAGAAGDIESSGISAESEGVDLDVAFSGSYDINIDIDMPIIKLNGEWKCDPQLSMMMSFYTAFSSMGDGDSASEFTFNE